MSTSKTLSKGLVVAAFTIAGNIAGSIWRGCWLTVGAYIVALILGIV